MASKHIATASALQIADLAHEDFRTLKSLTVTATTSGMRVRARHLNRWDRLRRSIRSGLRDV